MMKRVPFFLTLAACAVISACDRSPTTPSSGYAGEWSGTTSQGRPITLTVSSAQKITAITVGYSFGGCSGVNTFSNLNLDIGFPPNPAVPVPGPEFGFGSGSPEGPNYTQVSGFFTSNITATGSVGFLGYAGCPNTGAVWTATKR